MIDWQWPLVGLCTAVAAVYLTRRTWRTWFRKASGCGGFGGCGGGCSPAKNPAGSGAPRVIPVDQLRLRRGDVIK
jgi:hypothetical protein